MTEPSAALSPEAPALDSTHIRLLRAARPTLRTMILLAVAAVAVYAVALTVVLIRVERSNADVAREIRDQRQLERDHYFELRQLILLGGTGALHSQGEKRETSPRP